MVCLVGNYAADQWHSMDRFARMMLQGLSSEGVAVRLVRPKPRLGLIQAGPFVQKWLGYVDKFIIFPRELRQAASDASLIHICDHSNAPYVQKNSVPTVITCHDLLAVRSGLGEPSDHPPSPAGRILQRWILRGLRRASAVVCVSDSTRQDAERLVKARGETPELHTIHLAIDEYFRVQPIAEARLTLARYPQLDLTQPFVLHVGSNLRRKNREGVLRIFARVQERWPGQLVFAGEALTDILAGQARALGIACRIVEIAGPSHEELSALYNCAGVLLYPSRSEGFGWPIVEAQACGCPVLCSDSGAVAEVAGDGALIHPHEDETAFAHDLLRLLEEPEYQRWRARSLKNAERFSAAKMIRRYVELYRSLAPAL
jgi:glycosyltransferase involved in cell wall biosynthesis